MGCDIHLWVDRKETIGWRTVAQLFIDRNYTLFSVLADVRNSHGIRPIAQPRGLPAERGYPEWSAYEFEHTDMHSPSWLTLAELKSYDWQANDWSSLLKEFTDGWMKTLESLKDAGSSDEDIRIVFCFDN